MYRRKFNLSTLVYKS